MIETEPAEEFNSANNYAFKWFEIHAEQRLKVFNFFLIISGFCVGGFFAALQAENRLAASVISIVSVVAAYCFKQLDRRTAQLTKLAEDFLSQSLGALGEKLKSDQLNLVLRAENKRGLWSYRQIFDILFFLFGILGLLGAIFPWLQYYAFGCLT
jgi:hypothetical protein